MPRPRGRRAQKVKALAQHKNSVTCVPECQLLPAKDSQPLQLLPKRTKGEENRGSSGGASKRQKEAPLLPAHAGPAPAPQSWGLSAQQEGAADIQAVPKPSLGDQLQVAGGHANSRRQHGLALTQPPCPSSLKCAAGWFPSCPPLGPELA